MTNPNDEVHPAIQEAEAMAEAVKNMATKQAKALKVTAAVEAEAIKDMAITEAEAVKLMAIKEARGLSAEMGGLSAEMKGLADEMRGLRSYGRRNRRLVWIAIISVCFDLVLSFGLVFVAAKALNASHEAVSAKEANRQTCQVGNDTRAKQVILWDHILDISTNPNATAEQKQRADEFRAYVHDTFAPRDCESLG